MKRSVTITGLGAVAFVALGLYVWLTPYKYDHVSVGNSSFPVRINRITGKTQVFMMAAGWRFFEDAAEKKVENPQSWNAGALTASYDFADINENDHHIRFFYVVENTTDQDYRVETKEGISLGAKLAQSQSLDLSDDDSVKIQYPVLIPSKQRVRFSIEIQDRYAEKKEPSTKVLEEYVRTRFKNNLDGFVLFDTNKRYQVNFPKGW